MGAIMSDMPLSFQISQLVPTGSADDAVIKLTAGQLRRWSELANDSEINKLGSAACGPMICARAHLHPGSHMTAEEWATASQPVDPSQEQPEKKKEKIEWHGVGGCNDWG